MAQRRMFSIRYINSARFIKMPPTSQLLYFHLCMRADDDGIVEAYTVMQLTGIKEDDFRVLVAKKFIKPLNEDLVSYILDWNEHNLIRNDRKVDSIYRELLVQIIPDVEIIEPTERADTGKKTETHRDGQPMDNQWTAQDRLGNVKLSKDRENIYVQEFENFWKQYPKKVGKGKAYDEWVKIKPPQSLQEKILQAIEKQKKSIQWHNDNGQYIPNPATWLHQKRWDDELEEFKQKEILRIK